MKDENLLEFIKAAKSHGIADDTLVGLLKGRGWPQEIIYDGLAAHYENAAGLKIPTRNRSGAAAKDAFYYLLAFSTLATWTVGFGSLMFLLIEMPTCSNVFSASLPVICLLPKRSTSMR